MSEKKQKTVTEVLQELQNDWIEKINQVDLSRLNLLKHQQDYIQTSDAAFLAYQKLSSFKERVLSNNIETLKAENEKLSSAKKQETVSSTSSTSPAPSLPVVVEDTPHEEPREDNVSN